MRVHTLVLALVVVVGACGDNHEGTPDLVAGPCGDGVLNVGEQCDDGNTLESDGCDNNCSATACGNGVLDFNEGCDDGNDVNGDGCDNNCMQTFCGNGIMAGTETCDDGNTVSGDGCDNNCSLTACGNGVMTIGEGCDDGNPTEGDGCDTNCTVSACGNGVMGGAEQCDDGNTVGADGCSATCSEETAEIEPNEDGTPSTGGDTTEGNDFAIAAADTNGAFSTSVTLTAAITPAGDEDVFKLSNTGTTGARVVLDTWNGASGFGIGTSCGTASIDTVLNVRNAAGAILATNDDRDSSDYCAALQTTLMPGQSIYVQTLARGDEDTIAAYVLDVQIIHSVCGDGDVGPGEQCDDMNTSAGDGCSMTCAIEGGVTEIEPNEDGSPSPDGDSTDGNDFAIVHADANPAIIGDTTIIAAQSPAGDEDVFKLTNTSAMTMAVQLDTWNLESGFGIGVSCGTASIDNIVNIRDAAGTLLATNNDRSSADYCAGLTVPVLPGQSVYVHIVEWFDDDEVAVYALEVDFTPVVCGNNMVELGEECDDGNMAPNDGCSAICLIEPVCGNSIIQTGEQCDDGNMMSGDGCSMTCQIEGAMTEVEPNEDGSPSPNGDSVNGNDFAIANADLNGAITTNTTILAAQTPAGDEDVFKVTNTSSSSSATVRLDTWNLATGYGIGVSCGTSTIDNVVNVRDAAGALLATNNDRVSGSDYCAGLTITLSPGETVYVHVVEWFDDDTVATYALEIKFTLAVCGNGVLQAGEDCDDGNTTNGDGCSATCQLEGTIAEVEPNDTTAQATGSAVQITGDAVLTGALGVADLDTFHVTVAAATVVRFETFTSYGNCDATTMDLTLLDSAGAAIAEDLDNSGIGECAAIVAFLPAGTYFIQVEETGGDNAVAGYFLDVAFQDDTGTESEPNEAYNMTPSTNLVGDVNGYVLGDHMLAADIDVYAITVPPGHGVRAEVIEGDGEACEDLDVDSLLRVLDQNGQQLASDDDDGRGYCSLIDGTGSAPEDLDARNTTTTTQTYYVVVEKSSFASTTGGQFAYRLQLSVRQ